MLRVRLGEGMGRRIRDGDGILGIEPEMGIETAGMVVIVAMVMVVPGLGGMVVPLLGISPTTADVPRAPEGQQGEVRQGFERQPGA